MGHRVVDLFDFEKYKPDFPVKSGKEYVCLPYLSGILRLADELDITNDRTPDLLFNEYFPSDKVSKEEWEKHKANYLVNFKNDTIVITSNCHKKELYYALVKQYKKIEEVINNIKKLIRIIPQNNQSLQLKYSKLEININSIGFIPKDIGFSFNLQNTINTFIGDNIYKNKYVAIRECMQNAIDTCRYRKQIEGNKYHPEINITLLDKQLIITDDGLGMDEFIIENYFAKLAKSYYQKERVTNEFEAISQFGIGVFSYFLICDYFDVESKMIRKEAIKFRINDDVDNYFHFYDQTEKNSQGTSITFHLREEIKFDDLMDKVRHYIRYCEIPIYVRYRNRHEEILKQEFVLDIEKDLKDKIKLSEQKRQKNLKLIACNIVNEEYEGVIGFAMKKNSRGTYTPNELWGIFRGGYRENHLEVSQQGIYINNITDNTFNGVIGKLNMKRRNPLDIGRYNIKNIKTLDNIISSFHYKNLMEIFESWESKQKKTKANLSRNFMHYYLNPWIVSFTDEIFRLLKNNLYFKVYVNNSMNYLTIDEIDKIDGIIIVNSNKPFTTVNYKYQDIDDLYKHFNKPLLLEKNDSIASIILKIFEILNKSISIVSTSKHWYLLIKDKHQKYITPIENSYITTNNFYIFDRPHIASFPSIDTSSPFNVNHEVMKYYIKNIEMVSDNQDTKVLFKDFFKELHDFMFDFHVGGIKKPTDRIVIINTMLVNINQTLKTDFKLKTSDFPAWINRRINWNRIK